MTSLGRHALAAIVMLLAAMLAMPPAWSASNASWGGRVFEIDGITPRSGVVINLLDAGGQSTVRSAPTRDNGGFVIEQAPAGSYTLAIETPQGTFVAADPIELQPGVNRPQALSLQAGPINYQQEYGLGSAGLSLAGQWIIGLIVVFFAAFVIYEITDDKDTRTPPETPVMPAPN